MLKNWTTTLRLKVFIYLCTSTEASWVEEGEDVERDDSGQNGGKVQRFLRHLSAQGLSEVLHLGHGATGKEVLQHLLPLAIRPLIELRGKEKQTRGQREREIRNVEADTINTKGPNATILLTYPLANQIFPLFKDLQNWSDTQKVYRDGKNGDASNRAEMIWEKVRWTYVAVGQVVVQRRPGAPLGLHLTTEGLCGSERHPCDNHK